MEDKKMKTKENMKHTPGRWKIGKLKRYHHKEYVEILTVNGLGKGLEEISYEVAWTSKHNAPLISAAPELLEAAKNILLRESELTEAHDWLEYRALEKAVSKAEGRDL